jgi:nucleotide-binding universal stress UspA family protein
MSIEMIVVATDGSPNATRAVAHAAEIAQATGARVVAVHVFEPLARLGHVEPPVNFATQESDALALLGTDWSAPLVAAGVRFEPRVVEGVPASAIVELAHEVGADLIVLGARGLSKAKELLLGSISMKVLHSAHLPVTVVPPA